MEVSKTKIKKEIIEEFVKILKPDSDCSISRTELYGVYIQFNSIMSENPKQSLYSRSSFVRYMDKSGIRSSRVRKNMVKYDDGKPVQHSHSELAYFAKVEGFDYDKNKIKEFIDQSRELYSTINKKRVEKLQKLQSHNKKEKEKELYKGGIRKDNQFAHGNSDSIESFFDKEGYKRVFGRENYMQFKKLYIDYLQFCNRVGYTPLSRQAFSTYLKDMSYQINRYPGSGFLYININKESKIVDIKKIYDEKEKEKNEKPKLSTVDENFIRKFLNYNCNLGDLKPEEYCTVKELYAFFLVKNPESDISFKTFLRVLGIIPIGDLTIIDNEEVTRYIPSYKHIEIIMNKYKDSGYDITADHYQERVVKIKERTREKMKELFESKEEPKQVEVEEEVVVKEENNNDKKEVNELNNTSSSMLVVESSINTIKEQNAIVFAKYDALQKIRNSIYINRKKVHDELKTIFDLYASSASNSIMKAITEDEINKETNEVLDKFVNLTKFIKKD